MKKILSLILMLALVLSLGPTAFANSNINIFDHNVFVPDESIILKGGETCSKCGRATDDCICWMLDEEKFEEPDPHWYYPVSYSRSRDSFGLRENTVNVTLRPELLEDGTLEYSLSDNEKNQLRNSLRSLWLEEDGRYLKARTIVQYDLDYTLDRYRLASPGEESSRATGLKLENVPGLECDEPEAIRTKINMQDAFTVEASEVGSLSMGFGFELGVTEDGYELSITDQNGKPMEALLFDKDSRSGWSYENGMWQYSFNSEESQTANLQGETEKQFYQLLTAEIEKCFSEEDAETIKARKQAAELNFGMALKYDFAGEKLNLNEGELNADRFFTQQNQLYWRADKNTNAKLESLLSLDYVF